MRSNDGNSSIACAFTSSGTTASRRRNPRATNDAIWSVVSSGRASIRIVYRTAGSGVETSVRCRNDEPANRRAPITSSTQEALALRSGLSRNLLVDVELGKSGLLYERLFDLAAALDVSPDEFLKVGVGDGTAAETDRPSAG